MTDRSRRIADLNDAFRQSLELQTGQVLMTHGVSVLPPQERLEVFSLVKTFNAFNEDNDPYGEHDFGKIDYNGNSFFWKFDYYDKELQYESSDPSDLEQTTRVLTIMLACEY